MPSFETAKRIASMKNNGAKTIGQIHKENSDFTMEYTWDNDVQSKKCYIYDYSHDDYFVDEHGIRRSLNEGMTYENTNKTPIDAKFIVKSYQSLDKDQVEYYLQFKPSQATRFSPDDPLYYFETDYKLKRQITFPIGLFIDIPDDEKVYHKWLICRKEISNQFPKYLILPVSYELMWIERNGKERIKRRMWSALRQQLSYTIGTYTDRYITKMDNQKKIWLPMNDITEELWYTEDDSSNMRVVVSGLTKHPVVWTITKIENDSPFGLQKLTLYQNAWNEHTDYINLETGEMYADYYASNIIPLNPEDTIFSTEMLQLSASTNTLKVGGSYKTITATLNESTEDILIKYPSLVFSWTCSIDGENLDEKVVWKNVTNANQIKVKFPLERNYLGKLLQISCTATDDEKEITSIPFSLELIE